MHEAFSKNFIDYEEYPVSADIQNRCVSMIARLYNCPTDADANVMGTSTIGSSEAIMLATLAMKKRWQNKRKAQGKSYDKPNIVMNSAVQVCWEVCGIEPARRTLRLTFARKLPVISSVRRNTATALPIDTCWTQRNVSTWSMRTPLASV